MMTKPYRELHIFEVKVRFTEAEYNDLVSRSERTGVARATIVREAMKEKFEKDLIKVARQSEVA